jgi:glycosyltransferase involved in cell wall biosynthesis
MKRLKVLMLVSNLRISNGVSSFAMNYFRHIDHSKIQIDFALYSDISTPYYTEIKQCGSKIFILPSIKNIFEHIRRCRNILSQEKYDIIHDNTLMLSFPMMFIAKQLNIPVRILHSHNSQLGETALKNIRNRLFMPLLLGVVNHHFACSNLAGKNMFGNASYTVIPNVISSKKFNFDIEIRDNIRKKLNINNKFIIGSVGRLAYQKNPFFAVDVIVEAKKLIPNLLYWWIGTGSLDNQVKEYIKSKNADKYIFLLGNRTDVPALYQAMDLFFMPSTFEGLGIVAIEAEATGLPCLVSDTVPGDISYTDLVSFFSIKEDPADIAILIQQQKKKIYNRGGYNNALLESSFSDKNAGNFLFQIYAEMFNCTDRKR